jgi:phosphoribosylanthranilate isomerase
VPLPRRLPRARRLSLTVKICGLTSADAVNAAVDGGAGLTGFVFFPPSPRFLAPLAAAALARLVPEGVLKVGLVVDADDGFIEAILAAVPLDLLQLHGKECPERVAEVKARFGLPVMKAVAISGRTDLRAVRAYEAVADRLLFDAMPPKDATRPGGNALTFDWTLLKGSAWDRPWMLAGGLNAGNVAEAVRISGATEVDVSSGVEDAPGVKNIEKIKAFLAAARPEAGRAN